MVAPLSNSSTGPAPPRIHADELRRILRDIEPAVCLTLPRILRRVIRQRPRWRGIGLRIPHRKCCILPRDELLRLVAEDELDVPSHALPEVVILLPQPTADYLAHASAAQCLVKYWRLLFHAQIHCCFEQLAQRGQLNEAIARNAVHELSDRAFREASSVLKMEAMLLPPQDEVSIWIEFAAVYCELRYFAPDLLASYFPAIDDFARVDELIERFVQIGRASCRERV